MSDSKVSNDSKPSGPNQQTKLSESSESSEFSDQEARPYFTGRPEISVGGIAVDRDRLLMIQRGRGVAKGQWSIPGGRVEFGESLQAAVVREVFEETGIEVVCGQFLGWVERIGEGFHYVIMDFAVDVFSPGRPVAGDDAAQAKWVHLADITELDVVDGLVPFLAEHGYLDLIT
jgi:8-oxo-dGTP diphosphatase